jgi:hypothetical protein
MKKNILNLGCLCLLAVAGFLMGVRTAQADPVLGLKLGLEGGIDLANLNGQNVNDAVGSRLGFAGGAFADIPFTPTLAIQPEVLYEQKGGKYNGTAYQLDYVEVPILLNIGFGIPLINPSLLIGPTFNSNAANSGLSNINSNEMGLILGAQANLFQFLFSGRYEIGLTNVSSTQNIQNGTFTFLVGLSFI